MAERLRVKICGLTAVDDAIACAAAGAWAIGLVFYDRSPRHVTERDAAAIAAAAGVDVERVGVFVDAQPEHIARRSVACGLTMVQVHGEVDPAAVRRAAGLPVIQGFAVAGVDDLERARASEADHVLLDAAVAGRHGGTGATFSWELLVDHPMDRPFTLAGGLHPGNVADAIRMTGPAAVDVSSGVESAPGRKDADLVRAFVAASLEAARARAVA